MGLRKLRVEYWDGIKIVVLRDTALPATYDDFCHLVYTKVPALEVAARDYVLRFKFKDTAGDGIHLDEDDDLGIMYEEGDAWTVIVEAEEVTDETRDRLWSKDRFVQHKHSTPISLGPTLPRPPTAASGHSGDIAAAALPPALPNLSHTPPPMSLPRSMTTVATVGSAGSAATVTNLSRSSSLVSSSTLPGYSQIAQPLPYDVLSTPAREMKMDLVPVLAAGRQFRFQLEWRSSAHDSVQELMGVVGKKAWVAQRAWGYKKRSVDESEMSITYAPRIGTLRSKFSAETPYVFTIMFESRSLFNSALASYPTKIDTLSPSEFTSHLVEPVSSVRDVGHDRFPITTEWACVPPPEEFVPEAPRGSREYHVLYVVRDAKRELSEGAKGRIARWLKTQMIGGSWASDMVFRGVVPNDESGDGFGIDRLRIIG